MLRDNDRKKQIAEIFARANEEAAALFPDEKRALYRSLKLEGIISAPINICVTCDRRRGGPVVLGATHMADMDVLSTVCAVQNLWLAARSEGIGVGWVSILKEAEVKTVLGIPDEIKLVAYLCVGKVSALHGSPELEQRGWRSRIPFADLVFDELLGQRFITHGGQRTPGEASGTMMAKLKAVGKERSFVRRARQDRVDYLQTFLRRLSP